MFFGNIKCISGQMREICGMLITTSNSTACKNSLISVDINLFMFRCFSLNPGTCPLGNEDVSHRRIFHNLDIFTCLYLCKKLTCDFFTSNIFMKQNSRSGMGAFSCVQKFTIFLCKIHTIPDQIMNYIL